MDNSISSTEPQTTRLEAYQRYLQSPEWWRRRDRAIRLADWRCQRCTSKRELQVHHRTYERLGAERDEDLEVLCSACHEGHHHEQDKQTHLGVYIKLVSDSLRSQRFENFADLKDLVKTKCARMQLPYADGQVDRAIVLLDGRINFEDPAFVKAWKPTRNERGDDTQIGKAEAVEILRKLNIKVGFRSIPAAKHITPHQRDRVKAAQMVSQEILDSIQRCEELEQKAAEAKNTTQEPDV